MPVLGLAPLQAFEKQTGLMIMNPKRVPLASLGLESEDIEAMLRVLHSNNLTMGTEVKAFESEMAEYLRSKNFIMMNSGSSANLAIIEALMRPSSNSPILQPGDGVLLPAVAWPTTVWPVIQLGLTPLFVDVDPLTLAIDLAKAGDVIRSSNVPVRAIFPIHPLGRALKQAEFVAFSQSHGLVLISDVCESLGSWDNDVHAGLSSLASSFSFYFSHHITTMEGGGVATNDDQLADDLRSIRSHGWSRDRHDAATWKPSSTDLNSRFLFVSAGYNIRPMEIQAALGRGQIRRIDAYIARRREIASKVASALQGSDFGLIGSETLDSDPRSHSWMLLPISTPSREHASRALALLESMGIETRPILTGNFTSQPALQRLVRGDLNPRTYMVADRVTDNCFMVGCHHHFDDSQVSHLVLGLRSAAAL
jgi:CDP-6-deoxy-D-xylo-4-hexulose-3-dehydrase